MSTLILIVITISCTVAGNLFLKQGADQSGIGSFWPLTLLNFNIVLGITFFALGLLLYISVLQRLPLNIAQSIFSIQFIAVTIASAFVLGEPIGLLRWIGIGLVASGLFIVGMSIPTK